MYAGAGPDEPAVDEVFGSYQHMAARDVVEDLLAQEPERIYSTVEYAPGQGKYELFAWIAYRTVRDSDGEDVLEPISKFPDE